MACYISGKKIKTLFVTDVTYDSTNRKIQKTKAGAASDVVTLASVATSGSYNDLSNKPTIPSGVEKSTTTPKMDGTASVGSETKFAAGDHVHPSDTSRVPITRTINDKALSADITLEASDVGAVPTTRKVNGHALSASVTEDDSYTATISATAPYFVGTITVTMGGVDITSTAVSGNAISIAAVTGNIVITASGVLGNLIDYFGYTDNQRISTGNGGNRTKTGCTTIEYINLSEFVSNDTVSFHITGAQFIHKSSPWDDNAYAFYNASKGFTASGYIANATHGNVHVTCTTASDTDLTITITGLISALVTGGYSYLRLCGVGSGANVDIRVNE